MKINRKAERYFHGEIQLAEVHTTEILVTSDGRALYILILYLVN